MLLKDGFDETAFVKFQISNNLNKTLMKHIQNNKKSIGKSILAVGFKISRNNPLTKVSRFLLNVWYFHSHTPSIEIYSLGNGFDFYFCP